VKYEFCIYDYFDGDENIDWTWTTTNTSITYHICNGVRWKWNSTKTLMIFNDFDKVKYARLTFGTHYFAVNDVKMDIKRFIGEFNSRLIDISGQHPDISSEIVNIEKIKKEDQLVPIHRYDNA